MIFNAYIYFMQAGFLSQYYCMYMVAHYRGLDIRNLAKCL